LADPTSLYLLPGLLCDQATFALLRPGLADVAEVTVPDFFPYDSIAAMAEAVLACAPARVAVLGFSMGGRVALELVRRAPDRVSHLALLDTGVHPARPGEEATRQELIDLAYQQGMAALAARWVPPMLHPDHRTDLAFIGPITDMVCRATPDIHAGQIRALLGRPDARPGLPAIACPTLVACGRQDEWSPPAQHAVMAAEIPGADLVVLEHSGHFSPLEAAPALVAAMREWLARA
jgi:pimeloyl-ACP methyl ester carboxylesterase